MHKIFNQFTNVVDPTNTNSATKDWVQQKSSHNIWIKTYTIFVEIMGFVENLLSK